MYGLLWRVIPGPWPVKLVMLAVLLVGVLVALFLWVFPVVAPLVPFNEQTVEEAQTVDAPVEEGT